MKKYKVVIIGGTSNFGKLWVNYFNKKNLNVIVSTNNTEIKPKDAVKKGDIIIISVPIRKTPEIIKELIPYIGKNKLLIDFTGIKIDASNELKKYKLWEVVSVHPMFGPWIKSFKNQNISFDPIKIGEKWKFLSNILIKDGVNLIELESKKHDELIGIVQASVHLINLLLGHIIKKRDINLNELSKISTPNSRMQLFILSRFLNQNADLYTDMQMYNKMYSDEILPDLKKHLNFLDDLIKNKKHNEFENEFNSLKNFIGDDFLKKAFLTSEKIDIELRKK